MSYMLFVQPEVVNGETASTSDPPKAEATPQDEVTANEHGLNFLGESEVSSRSQIHADAPPFYPSSSHAQPQASFDKDFASSNDNGGWDDPSRFCKALKHVFTVKLMEW